MALTPLFTNAEQKRNLIHEKALEGVRLLFPIDSGNYRIEMTDAYVEGRRFSPNDEKAALLQRKSLLEPLFGTVVLKTKEGKVVDTVKNFKLFDVPYLTDHFVFIVEGNAYSVSNQLRTKPGVYTRVRRNEVPEVAFNLSKGANFKVTMEPESSIFKLELGTSTIPLYPILKALGMPDAAIRGRWGPQILDANQTLSRNEIDSAIDKLYKKLVPLKEQSPGHDVNEKTRFLRTYFESTQLDPETTMTTLGKAYKHVGGPTILDASDKLLKVFRSEEEHDDRDSLEFQTIHSVEDFVKERLVKGGPEIIKKLIFKMQKKGEVGTVRDAIPPSPFNKAIKSLVTQFSLSRAPDQINPLEMLDSSMKVTRLGDGGISTPRAVPEDTRALHTSHVGIIDPVRTPESSNIGIDVRLTVNTAKDADGNLYTKVKDLKTGKSLYVSAKDLRSKILAFPGQTMSGTVEAIKDGKVQKVPVSSVDYALTDAASMFGPSAGLLPFVDNMQGNRATMGSKQITQALPLKDREAPYVQARDTSDNPFKSMHASMGANIAKRTLTAGMVHKISDDQITIKDKAGKLHVTPYHTDLPLNSKTYLTHDLVVKVGDKVKAGQLIADSNFTKGGDVALGRNALVAYMAYHGENTNDAIVVSQGAANKFTSLHMFKKSLDLEADITLDKRFYLTQFPNKYPPSALTKVESDGVIAKGSHVSYGDPLVLAVRLAPLSATDQMLGRLHTSFRKKYRDISLLWDYEHPGVVTEVTKMGGHVTVTVKMEAPAVVGDKLCYASDTEFLTKQGWKFVSDVTFADKIATLNPDSGELEYHHPEAIHEYPHQGDMISLQAAQVNHLVTPDHKLWAKLRNSESFEPIEAKKLLNSRVRLLNHFKWVGTPQEFFTLPAVDYKQSTPKVSSIKMSLWLEFLGYYLADGYTSATAVSITKYQGKKPEHHDRITKLFIEMGFTPRTEKDGRVVTVSDKTLGSYLKRFSISTHKFIPREFLDLETASLQILFDALMSCDGHDENGRLRYFTTSKQLADDVQELTAKLGYSSAIRVRDQSHIKEICGVALKSTAPLYTVCINRTRGREPIVSYLEGHACLVPYSGTVYCVTIPNHILYTRRAGKTVFSMNSGSYGNKGVISKIVPDDQMPTDERGRPLDILLAPTGVVSRINPGQLLETALGKVAEKTGNKIVVDNFDPQDRLAQVKGILKAHGVKDKETVTDPVTGREIPGVMVGRQYFYKLFKSTDTNFGARGTGAYDINEQPSRGGEEGSKRFGGMELNALLAHGATSVADEAFRLKGQKNEQWWNAYKLGLPLPPPKRVFITDKFNSMLAGAGINVKTTGDKVQLSALTDKDISRMSQGTITAATVLRKKDLRPELNGLFDPLKTGGIEGEKWSDITLSEPIIKPAFMKPAASLLRMSETKLGHLIMGKGGHHVLPLLRALKLDKLKDETENELTRAHGAKLDQAVKRMKYIAGLERMGMTPHEAYMGSKLAVVPPKMRPIVPGPNNQLLVADSNHLYRDVLLADMKLKEMKAIGITAEADLSPLRKELWQSVSALAGLSEPTSYKLRQQGKKGFVAQIAGVRPAEGFFQEKVYGRAQDLSGRGTIVPDPTLRMDEIGLPEETAKGMYKPFVLKRLVSQGFPAVQAAEHVEKWTPAAMKALEAEAKDRPVIFNRAPSLHRFSLLAAYPKLVPGKTIRINPFVEAPLGADFDGDAIQLHAPVMPKAVADARRMTLDKLLFSDKSRSDLLAKPEMEAVAGLHEATRHTKSGKTMKFKNRDEAMQAYLRGDVKVNDTVEIG